MNVLVIDIGGTHVKTLPTEHDVRRAWNSEVVVRRYWRLKEAK